MVVVVVVVVDDVCATAKAVDAQMARIDRMTFFIMLFFWFVVSADEHSADVSEIVWPASVGPKVMSLQTPQA